MIRILVTYRKNQINNIKLKALRVALLMVVLPIGYQTALGQSNLKEGFNQFALYSKSADIKLLDKARTHIDAAYVTRKDTTSFRNNLLRSLVYSTLSVVDSNRTKKYKEDPIVTATRSLGKLKDKQLAFESEPEINYVKRYLSNAHLILGNRAIAKQKYAEAYKHFHWVDSTGSINNPELQYNLAVLSQKTGNSKEALLHFKILTENSKTSRPQYFMSMADIYESQNDSRSALEALKNGREQFPNNQDILFRLVNLYQKNQDYSSVLEIIDDALKIDNRNTYLLYLAGYSEDLQGNFEKAKIYYTKVTELDPNHYKANYSLGLIHLRAYLEDTKSKTLHKSAEDFLLRANQIAPSAPGALKSLAILYQKDGNIIQLERVNNILNQITLN